MEEERETTVGAFEINGEQAGVFIDPPSDVEMTYIQCPPSFAETKVNPRSAVVLSPTEQSKRRTGASMR